MISKKNWQLMKGYLDYRLRVDQISEGSLLREQTHMRYILEWAQERSFRDAAAIRPTFPEYMLSSRLDGREGQLSAVYIKKTLATARQFFTWLSENEAGYKHIKQSWIRKIIVKRLSDIPRTSEYVTLEEVLAIAARPARTARARRARAALVFLFLSGMRIGAFVTLPLQAVDIPNRCVYQYPSFGVKTKNGKHGITYLYDIPELLKIVQDWDNEVRSILPPNGYWFAPLSFITGEIDLNVVEVGKHRLNLARRDFEKWLQQEGLPYHSPHKFRHGHVHYGLALSKNVADYKAVSMNVMHASMDITDKVYSVLQNDDVKSRISALNKSGKPKNKQELVNLLLDVISSLEGE
jgi:integrase